MKYCFLLYFVSLVLSVPIINIPTFDVRERHRDCWNWGYSQLINVIFINLG